MQWEILIAAILVIGIGLAIKGALHNRISRRAMTGEAGKDYLTANAPENPDRSRDKYK